MKVRLVVVKGRPEGMEIPLPMSQFLIGRDPRCNLRPNSESVSKLHCAILQRSEGVFARDMQSTNGTFINNDRIHGEVQMKDGDLLRVGPLVLAIKIEVADGQPARPPAGDEEDQAVSWLLDYSASARSAPSDIGSKTTIMDMRGTLKPASPEKAASDSETKAEQTDKPADEKPKPRARTATAEVAGDLLDKLLTPARKKKV